LVSKQPRSSQRDSVLALGVGVTVALVYLLTLSGNHSETEDSVNFARRIRDDPHSHFFEGAHVVFDWVAWAFYELVRATGITQDPLRTVQVFDALLAGATVGLLAAVLASAGVSPAGRLVACGTLAFSYSFWRNSIDVEVYTLSAVALVASLGAAVRAAERPSERSFGLLGLLNGAAVLAHVTNVIFAPVAFVAVMRARRRRPEGGAARWFASYAAAAVAVVVAVYAVAAAVLRLGSPREFWDWLTAETSGGGGYGSVSVHSAAEAVIGAGRGFVGAHSALAIGAISRLERTHFPSKPLREEHYFLRGFSSSLAVVLLVGAAVIAVVAVILAASWARRRSRPRVEGPTRTVAVLCATWLVVYAVFFAFWDPLNIELWYVVWIPAAVVLGLAAAGARPRPLLLYAGAALVVLLFAVNLVGSVLPQRANARDYWRTRAQWYVKHLHHDDLLISYDYVWSSYLSYLTHGHVVDAQAIFKKMPREEAARRVLRIAESSHARRVYLSGYDFDPYPGDPAACDDGFHSCENAAALRRLLLPRAHLVARTQLERVYVYERSGPAA
jgi:hypothetical protein